MKSDVVSCDKYTSNLPSICEYGIWVNKGSAKPTTITETRKDFISKYFMCSSSVYGSSSLSLDQVVIENLLF